MRRLLLFIVVLFTACLNPVDIKHIEKEKKEALEKVERFEKLVTKVEQQKPVSEPTIKQKDSLYEAVVSFIKSHEGYRGKPYPCINTGKPTIGYGHIIKSTDSFPDSISRVHAEKILRRDLDAAIKLVDQRTDLSYKQTLAMGHFVFCKGIGTFTWYVLPLIKEGKTIDSTLLSMAYPKNRKFELKLWNN